VARFFVADLVGQPDKLAVLDGFTHAESKPTVQKMDAPKILTASSS
jgi:hypothetical protein